MAHGHVLWIAVVLDAFAVFRLTRLVVQDTISDPFRRWLDRNFTGGLVTLFSCPWCMSVWFAGGAAAATYFAWFVWQWVALAFAAAGAAGFLAEHS
jgi:hypothetical protein